MDRKNHMMLQRLIVELDDTAKLYSAIGCTLVSVYTQEVVARIVLEHQSIAADLVEHMCMMSVRPVRRSSMFGKLRAHYAAWRPTGSGDFDSNCLVQIEYREVQVMQHFRETVGHVAGLEQRMHHHLGTLQDLCAPVTSMLDQAGLPLDRERHKRSGTNQSLGYAPATASTSAHTCDGSRNFYTVSGTHRSVRTRSASRGLEPVYGFRHRLDPAHSGFAHVPADVEATRQPAGASKEVP